MTERKIRKKIEWAFFNYEENRHKALEYTLEYAASGVPAGLSILNYYKVCRGSSEQVEFSERELNRHLEGNSALDWCAVVENTMTSFAWSTEYTIIELRYFKRTNFFNILDSCGVSERTYYRIIENILNVAEKWARKLNLIS